MRNILFEYLLEYLPGRCAEESCVMWNIRKRDFQYLTLYVTKSILIQFESCYSFYTIATNLSP
jgi:hypothetical protein